MTLFAGLGVLLLFIVVVIEHNILKTGFVRFSSSRLLMLPIESFIFVRNGITLDLDTCSPVGKKAEAPFAPISYIALKPFKRC